MTKKRIVLFLCTALVVLASCKDRTEPEQNPGDDPKQNLTLKGISLNKSSLVLERGESEMLVVSYEPKEAASLAEPVVWKSQNQSIATVDDQGVVTAGIYLTGTTVITATSGEFSAECEVTVTEIGFEVDKDTIRADAAGGSYELKLTTSTSWKVKCSADWASVDVSEGEGDATVSIIVEKTHSDEDKMQQVVVTFNYVTDYKVTLISSGKTPTEDDVPIGADGDSYYNPQLFSISKDVKVYFSYGNLSYRESDRRWIFAGSYVRQQENNEGASNRLVFIDMFPWGSGNSPLEYSESSTTPEFVDWGVNAIYEWGGSTARRCEPDTWRTPTIDEWNYVLFERPNADKLCRKAVVNNNEGLILLPDNFDVSASPVDLSGAMIGRIDVGEWQELEKLGAVFLVAAGYKEMTSWHQNGINNTPAGYYWSSTPDTFHDNSANMIWFDHIDGLRKSTMSCTSRGCAVRMISEFNK